MTSVVLTSQYLVVVLFFIIHETSGYESHTKLFADKCLYVIRGSTPVNDRELMDLYKQYPPVDVDVVAIL